MEFLIGGIFAILIISLVFALVFYLQKNDRKEKVQCEKMLMDVFKMQVKLPELSLVYDTVKKEAKSNLIEQYELKKEPFIIYFLSVLDLVIDYYFGRSIYAAKDPVMKSAWLNTINNFYRDSTDGRNVYLAHHNEFNSRFQNISDDILRKLVNEEPL